MERLTERAHHATVLARRQAELLRHDAVGTGHLLIGLVEEDLGTAAQVLSSVGLTAQVCVDRVVELKGWGGAPPTGEPPFTPRARRAVERAWEHAESLGLGRISTEHLLLGLLDEDDSTAAEVLARSHVSVDDLRDRLLAALHGLRLPPPRRTTTVYLSYARPVDLHLAGRLADHLTALGLEIAEAVERADVLLVLISPQWTFTDPGELESALRHAVRVVPVLVDGAELPDVEPLRLPTFRHLPRVRHETFRRDVQRLAEALEDE